MGNWAITIIGSGSHHNADNPADANLIARDLVQRLVDNAKTVSWLKRIPARSRNRL